MPAFRSYLFVPGDRPHLLDKADASGADVVILDLEDSVSVAVKESARRAVANALGGRAGRPTAVRINATLIEQDLAVLAPHADQIVMLPKVETREAVTAVDNVLASFERAAGLPAQTIGVVIGIESALGLRNMYEVISSTARVQGAALATAEEGDLIVDLGGRWTPRGEALAYCRGKFVCDARAAGARWLIDGAFMNLADNDALAQEASIARAHGLNGKVAIHPRQVDIINRLFSPSEADLAWARQVVEAFRAAETEGRGAIQLSGRMIDYANVRLAEQLLARGVDMSAY